MTGLNSNKIASFLLPHAEKVDVADILMTRSDSATATAGRIKTAPSPKVASKYIKGKLNHVLLLVSHPDTDPDVLAKAAKDTRVSVRQALIKNPSTPYDTMVMLAKWAHERRDDTMAQAILRLNAQDTLTVLEEAPSAPAHYYPYETLAKRLTVDTTREEITRAFKIPNARLRSFVSYSLYERKNPPITLTELFAENPEVFGDQSRDREALVAFVADSAQHCSIELAALLADDSSVRSALNSSLEFIFMADGAAEVLLRSPSAKIRLAAARSGARGDLLNSTIFEGNPQLLAALAREVNSGFTKAQEISMVSRLTGFAGEEYDASLSMSLAEVLSVCTHRMPSKVIMSALRALGGPATERWLSGQFKANQPRPGEITALLADPQNAFISPAYRYGAAIQAVPEVKSVLIRNLDAAMRQTWAKEYALAVGEHLIPAIPRSHHTAAWVTKRFHAAFGANENCWETALTLAVNWTGDIEELVSTVLVINDVEEPELIEAISTEEQLSFADQLSV